MIERQEYQEIKDLYTLLKIKPKSFNSLSQELYEHILIKNQEFLQNFNEKTGPIGKKKKRKIRNKKMKKRNKRNKRI
jgi:hypothetical protein